MFSQMAYICHFVLFVCPAQSLLWVYLVWGSFPVQSGGSLIIFQLLRCRNVALIRVFFLLFLEVGMFYTWGLSACALHLYAPYVLYALIHSTPLEVYTPPYVPHTPLCICMFSEDSACCGVDKGPLTCWTTSFTPPPVWGCLPICLQPHSFIGFPVHQYVSGISVCDVGNNSHMLGVWGMFSHLLVFLGALTHGASICLFLYILGIHCLTFLLWAMTTTLPVMVVSSGLSSVSSVTVAPSLMGLLTVLDHHEVQTPPLMPRGSGGVIGPASVPQQQPPSLMPLLAYASYAMGSPQVGFFFRVEPLTILYIVCWCPFWCLLFAFRCQVGCSIHLSYGGSTVRVCTFAALWSLPMAGICATWWWSSVHVWYAYSCCSSHYLE